MPHFLCLGHDRAVTASQMQQLDAMQPGVATRTLVFSLNEFDAAAKAERDKIDFVILAPSLTDEEVASARQVVAGVWGKVKDRKDEPGPGKWVLRIPASLKGKQSTIVDWVEERVQA